MKFKLATEAKKEKEPILVGLQLSGDTILVLLNDTIAIKIDEEGTVSVDEENDFGFADAAFISLSAYESEEFEEEEEEEE